jgi:hypothetical protein
MTLDERTLQEAAAALELGWMDRATDRELDLLVEAGRRPERFEESEPGEIRVVLHPTLADAFGDAREDSSVIVRTGPPDPTKMAEAADLVTRRIRLRTLLALPASDCGARKPNPKCSCLTSALDELGEQADREGIVLTARKRHVRRRPPLRRRSKAKPAATEVAPAPVRQPIAALMPGPPVERPPDPPQERGRWRQRGEDAHPLSPYAFRRNQEGESIDWLSREF